jgi:phosphonate transport system substrate-binding protein
MSALKRRAILGSMLGGGLSSWAMGQQARRGTGSPLVFGLITPRSAEQTRQSWLPFVQRMAAALQRPIELQMFAEQSELISRFANNSVDLAWMGNAAALDAVLTGNAAVFAQMITKDGSYGYRSILVVPTRSAVTTLVDAIEAGKTLRFGDGDLKSMSGHAVPAYFAFQKHGVNNANSLFLSVTHNSHQKNLTLAANDELDLVTANNDELAFFARDYPTLAKKVRVVWESPLIPQSPLVWRTSLPLDFRLHVLRFTLGFGKSAEEKNILLEMNSLSGFRQSSNRQLVAVADIEMFKARKAIDDDPALSVEERGRRIDDVMRRAAKLDLMLKLSAAQVR